MCDFSPSGFLNAKQFAKKHSLLRSQPLKSYITAFFLIICLLIPSVAHAQIEKKNILILNSYHKEFPWTDAQVSAIKEVLTGQLDDLELHVEYMDTKRLYGEDYLGHLLQIYIHKYSEFKIDAIITTDDNALNFVLKHHKEAFNESPVSFCGINDYRESMLVGRDKFTGLIEVLDIWPTIELAMKLHPSTRKIFVIIDNTPTGIGQKRDVAAVAKLHCPDIEFEFLDGADYSNQQLIEKLSTLPKDSIVLLTVWLRDKDNLYLPVEKTGPMLSSASTVPIYGVTDMHFGHGIIGGKLLNSSMQGKVAAELAVRILKGEKPSHIPVITESTNPYMFDYQQLHRWQISISDLPKDSVIINQPAPIVKERKRLQLVLALAIIEGLIIALLIINAIRGRTGREFFANIEYHMIALTVVFGLIIWLFDTAMDYFYFYEGISFWKLLLFDIPAHELYMRLLMLISFTLLGILISVMLVKRRQAERTLRLRNTAIYNSPNGVIIANHVGANDNPVVYVNPSFEKITGYSLDEVKGRDCRFLQGSDRDQPGLDEIHLALKQQRLCHATVRNYRKDGTMFWNKLSIIPVRNDRNELTHYIGIISDITGQRQAQQKLKKSQERLSMALDAANDGLWDWNIKTGEVYFSPRYYTMLGYKPNEFEPTYQAWTDLLHPDDKNGVEERIREHIERKSEGFEEEFRLKTKTQEWRWILSRGKVVQWDPDGNPVRMVGTHVDITRRKTSETLIAISEERFRTLVDNIPGIVYRCRLDEHWSMYYITQGIEKLSGYPPHEFVENKVRSFASIIHPEDRQMVKDITFEKVNKNQMFSIEYRIITFDGNIKWVYERGTGVRDEVGNILFLDGVIFDITKRKQAEEKLRIQRYYLEKAQEMGSIGTWELDIEKNKLVWTDQNYRIFGVPIGTELTYDIFLNCIHPDDRQYVDKQWADALKGKPYDIEHRLIVDGKVKWVREKAELQFDEKGRCIRGIGFTQDITERKLAQQEIERIFNMTDYMICIATMQGYFKRINPTFEQVLGYSSQELLSRPFYDFIHPDDIKKTKVIIEEKLSQGVKIVAFENRYLCKDGSYKWLSWSSEPVAEDGLMYAIGYDITERKQAEEKVLNLAKFPSENPSPVLRVSKDGKLLYANDACESLLKHWQCGLGDTIPEYWHKIVLEVFESGQNKKVEFDCDRQVLSLVLAAVKQADYVNLYGRDVTERKQAELERERLLKTLAAKNEELESIVYVSSHDLRSPLINIQGYSTELQQSCKQAAEIAADTKIPKEIADKLSKLMLQNIPESLDYITASAGKMDMLLTGLLKLSRLGRAALELEILDIDAMISEVIESMQFTIKESGAELTVDKLPPCLGDKTQINQVFTNLLDNAIKYLDPSRKGLIRISGKVENAMSVYCVKDNGIGIAPQHQDKVFEIFHQLEPKEPASGQGLGLTIVQRIIDRHNGNVWLRSEPGKGSSFYIALPHPEGSTG